MGQYVERVYCTVRVYRLSLGSKKNLYYIDEFILMLWDPLSFVRGLKTAKYFPLRIFQSNGRRLAKRGLPIRNRSRAHISRENFPKFWILRQRAFEAVASSEELMWGADEIKLPSVKTSPTLTILIEMELFHWEPRHPLLLLHHKHLGGE